VVVHGFFGLTLPLFALALWPGLVAAVTAPLWWWAAPRGSVSIVVPLTSWPRALIVPPLAAVAYAVLLYWLVPALARLEGLYAKVLLGPSEADLVQRVEELTETRAEALEAHGAELRRIERDLHDGTQAQLVTVALRLGLAARRFDADPDGARDFVLQAREGVEEALTDLRTVIRGIYPPILSDRGLVGAIRSLAAGRPIPVAVDIADADRRCPAAVEAAAYFVVAEALTNVSKHSGASAARVALRHQGPYLRIVVSDDGRGGADPAAGSGLAGIRRRVAAFDGVTRIISPAGSGTTLEVDLPCGL
jgi:signal transduction histidine kinase